MPADLLSVFSHQELCTLIAGKQEVDVAEWKRNTRYGGGLSAGSRVVEWFWQIVRDFSTEQRNHLLEYATGCAWVPPGGFATLQGSRGNVCTFKLNPLPGHRSAGWQVLPRCVYDRPVARHCFVLFHLHPR